MDKKYISKIVNGSDTLWIKDAEARSSIESLQNSVAGGTHYLGKTTSANLVDGYAQGVTVGTGASAIEYIASGTPTEGQALLVAGDIVIKAAASGSAETALEYIWDGSKWSELGSTGHLGTLAYKDSASGSYTPAGSNADSAVSFSGTTDGDFVTGFSVSPVLPSFTEGSFTPASLGTGFYSAGTAPSFTEGQFTPAAIQEGFVTAGSAASYSHSGFSGGSLGSATTGTFVTGYNNDAVAPSLGAATTGAFATEGVTVTVNDATETLTIATASTSNAVTAQGTFSAGSAATLATASAVTAQGAFTPASYGTDTFDGGTPTAIDVTKFSGGSKAADTFSAGTMASIDVTKFNGGSKASDTFSAGTAPTLSTSKAITALGTATAAGQTFTGTAATVTVA